jgi:hypothetical protein
MTNLRIYGFLRLGEDLIDTEAQLNIFDFLTGLYPDVTYDWDTSKLKLKLTINSLESLLAIEDYLIKAVQGNYTATLEISADIKGDKFVEKQMTYKLFYSPDLNEEVKQLTLKLFPAIHLIS